MKQLIYTGVGSRKTPTDILILMSKIARDLANRGWLLRSGAADGADNAFESGHIQASFNNRIPLKTEIYLPWRNFNGHTSTRTPEDLGEECYHNAEIMAKLVHPAWNTLSQGARKLHARNVWQVLGKDLGQPSNLLICWTENGEVKGGTATAIKLANSFNIPVVNLAVDSTERLKELIKKIEDNNV